MGYMTAGMTAGAHRFMTERVTADGARRELEQTLLPLCSAGGPSRIVVDLRSPAGEEPQGVAWLALCARGHTSRNRPVVIVPTEPGIRRFLLRAADLPGVFDPPEEA